MKTPKEKLTESITREMNAMQEMLDQVNSIPINLISEMFPEGKWQKNWSDVEFLAPMSFALIEQFKAAMTEQFPNFRLYWENQYVWTGTAGRFLKYKDDETQVSFEVAFRSEVKGSTCVLNPIGREMKEVITYEVVCGQEATQEFTAEAA